MTMPLPRNLVEAAQRQGRADWLLTLPGTLEVARKRWSLDIDDPYEPGGSCSWVAPARTAAGDDVVVKVVWRHPEAEHEADALRVWDGDGAVRLYGHADIDESTSVLVLERCASNITLASRPEHEQDSVVASLLRRLWLEPPPPEPFRPLQSMCDLWADEFEKKLQTAPCALDPGLVREGVSLFRTLPATSDRAVLLCTDLHAHNVLAADRQPWLVIDPKPYAGDPTYDPLQHMLNCPARLADDPDRLVGRMAGLLELHRERLRLWLFARCVIESIGWPSLAAVASLLKP